MVNTYLGMNMHVMDGYKMIMFCDMIMMWDDFLMYEFHAIDNTQSVTWMLAYLQLLL